MMKLFPYIKKFRWYLVATVIFAGGSYYYFGVYKATNTAAATTFYAVQTVAKGDVSSGIQTTGTIVAAQKLDIDVYKQLSRINTVNVQNGSHVEAGKVLVSFDKSDALVGTKSSQVAVTDAALQLQNAQASSVDPNTQIRTLENQIAGYQKAIADAAQGKKDAFRNFLNKNLEVVPGAGASPQLDSKAAPTLSGRYVSDVTGEYDVAVYSSGTLSGYSYKVAGLETALQPVIFGKANDLGTRGLKITFPPTTRNGDTWVIRVPNTDIAAYTENKQAYDQSISDLDKASNDAQVNLTNATQQLDTLKRTDSSAYRDLSVEKAQASLSEARQKLVKSYDVVHERDIVAPFAGTVQDMQNVVVGATPVGGTSDSINLGTLISDEFLTKFTLSAADAAKVTVGQKVKVVVTSIADQPTFEAKITEISSLPATTGVAQYEVRALLNYDRTKASLILREGMLADIEIVQEENTSALRVPASAVTYENGKAKVTVVDKLTDIQKQEADKMGFVKTAAGTTLATYVVPVELGIRGKYFVEVKSGLKEGDIIVTSSLTKTTSTTSAVDQAGPGGNRAFRQTGSTGTGGGASGTNTTNTQSGGNSASRQAGG
jgi:HlyD family secretion protein